MKGILYHICFKACGDDYESYALINYVYKSMWEASTSTFGSWDHVFRSHESRDRYMNNENNNHWNEAFNCKLV